MDDCFSRVFEKLWVHGEGVNPAARGAWLFVVARREAALQWRKQKRTEELLDGFAGEFDELRENKAPEDGLIQAEIADRLRLAADQLSKEQQDVLRKRFYEDMSFREIAEELGIPLGTALTRLHAALKRLRSVLDE